MIFCAPCLDSKNNIYVVRMIDKENLYLYSINDKGKINWDYLIGPEGGANYQPAIGLDDTIYLWRYNRTHEASNDEIKAIVSAMKPDRTIKSQIEFFYLLPTKEKIFCYCNGYMYTLDFNLSITSQTITQLNDVRFGFFGPSNNDKLYFCYWSVDGIYISAFGD